MKVSMQNAIIFILVTVVAILSLLLIQSQKTIENQRSIIVIQEAQINELETEVAKLSELSREKIINDAKAIIRDEGLNFLNTLRESVLQE